MTGARGKPPSQTHEGPAVIAHRGGLGRPENTLDAVHHAIELGVDGVEIDVQVGPDGRLVTGHDLIEPHGRQQSVAGSPFADVLRTAQAADISLVVDFKTAGDHTSEALALVHALAEVTQPDLVLVSSFSIPFLDALAELDPTLDLAPIVSLRQNFPVVSRVDRWAGVSVLAAALLLNPAFLFRLRRSRKRLLVWFGVTDWPFVIALIARLGADAVIVADARAELDRQNRLAS